MKFESLHDLFVHELEDLYDAEQQITEALPKMQKAASSAELKAAFGEHLDQTKNQIKRLEQVFQAIGEKPSSHTCKAMKGIIKEGEEMLEADAEKHVKDAGLIASAQRVEHYEIAGYGTARTYAYLLGQEEAARLLQETLDEEELTDKKLTKIATSINVEAV